MDEDDLETLKVGSEAAEVWATTLDDNKTGLVASLRWFDSVVAAKAVGLTTPKVGMADDGVDLPELNSKCKLTRFVQLKFKTCSIW